MPVRITLEQRVGVRVPAPQPKHINDYLLMCQRLVTGGKPLDKMRQKKCSGSGWSIFVTPRRWPCCLYGLRHCSGEGQFFSPWLDYKRWALFA
jgi:hypothetical protein